MFMSYLKTDADCSEETDFLVTVTPEDFATARDLQIFAERIQQAIDDARSNGSNRLALDLAELEQIRSVGLNGLIAANSNGRCVGLSVVLLNVQAKVREVFSLTRLERMFEFEERSTPGNPVAGNTA